MVMIDIGWKLDQELYRFTDSLAFFCPRTRGHQAASTRTTYSSNLRAHLPHDVVDTRRSTKRRMKHISKLCTMVVVTQLSGAVLAFSITTSINIVIHTLDAYSRAIHINPYISEVWFDLGSFYKSCNNQIVDTIDAYSRAAELDSSNQVIKQT